MSQPKATIIAEAYRHHDGIWPRSLTSGIMYFKGVTILQHEFEQHNKKQQLQRK